MLGRQGPSGSTIPWVAAGMVKCCACACMNSRVPYCPEELLRRKSIAKKLEVCSIMSVETVHKRKPRLNPTGLNSSSSHARPRQVGAKTQLGNTNHLKLCPGVRKSLSKVLAPQNSQLAFGQHKVLNSTYNSSLEHAAWQRQGAAVTDKRLQAIV